MFDKYLAEELNKVGGKMWDGEPQQSRMNRLAHIRAQRDAISYQPEVGEMEWNNDMDMDYQERREVHRRHLRFIRYCMS